MAQLSKKYTVLITDKVHPLLPEHFKALGWDVIYDTSITMKELPEVLPRLHGIVINSKIQMNTHMIDMASDLKFIARLGSGMEIIDTPYAHSKGIVVVNSPEGNRDSVAEHAIGMLLMLVNKLPKCDADVRSFEWNREANRGMELMGKTLGIIGLGHTGSSVGRRLATWGLDIIYHDILPSKELTYGEIFRKVSLQDILRVADIITLHLPLTEETTHLVDDDFIKSCKDGAIIINTSRGRVVDTKALVKGLRQNKLGGACLDVFENEKMHTLAKDEKECLEHLFSFDNTVVSPHVAGWTNESLEKISYHLIKKLESHRVI